MDEVLQRVAELRKKGYPTSYILALVTEGQHAVIREGARAYQVQDMALPRMVVASPDSAFVSALRTIGVEHGNTWKGRYIDVARLIVTHLPVEVQTKYRLEGVSEMSVIQRVQHTLRRTERMREAAGVYVERRREGYNGKGEVTITVIGKQEDGDEYTGKGKTDTG